MAAVVFAKIVESAALNVLIWVCKTASAVFAAVSLASTSDCTVAMAAFAAASLASTSACTVAMDAFAAASLASTSD